MIRVSGVRFVLLIRIGIAGWVGLIRVGCVGAMIDHMVYTHKLH